MTPQEIQKIIDEASWIAVGEGTYNSVVKSTTPLTLDNYSGYWVQKMPKQGRMLNDPDRAIRKWRLFNPTYPAYRTTQGWVAPYLGNIPATDAQVAKKLIEIYRRTRTIIVDACVLKNFLIYNGDVVCVDVDLALRRGSIVSDTYIADEASGKRLADFFTRYEKYKPQILGVIKTLMWLEKWLREDEIKHEYITIYFLRKVNFLRSQEKPLNGEMAKALYDMIESSRGEILNGYLIPLLEAGKVNCPAIPGHLHPIYHAIELGLLKQVQLFLTTNPELVHLATTLGLMPLDVAIRKGFIEIAHVLMDAGARSGFMYESLNGQSLEDLIKNGSLEGVRLLLKHNPSLLNQPSLSGYAPLHYAIGYNQPFIFQFLLDAGADINLAVLPIPGVTHIHANMTPLDMAYQFSIDAFAMKLAEKRAVCNKLRTAVRANQLERVMQMIAARPECLNETDEFNQTALIYAAVLGHEDIVTFLIAQGANLNMATQMPPEHEGYGLYHGATALDKAREQGHLSIAASLETAGAIANKQSPPGSITETSATDSADLAGNDRAASIPPRASTTLSFTLSQLLGVESYSSSASIPTAVTPTRSLGPPGDEPCVEDMGVRERAGIVKSSTATGASSFFAARALEDSRPNKRARISLTMT